MLDLKLSNSLLDVRDGRPGRPFVEWTTHNRPRLGWQCSSMNRIASLNLFSSGPVTPWGATVRAQKFHSLPNNLRIDIMPDAGLRPTSKGASPLSTAITHSP